MESHELAARARRAYEGGRVRLALRGIVPVIPIVGLAVALGDPSTTGWLAAALVVACLACLVIGRGLQRAVRPGWTAGLVPMLVALATIQRFGCASRSCAEVCMPLCATAGVLVGIWLGVTMRAHERPGIAATALGIAALTAAMGCTSIGLGTFLGSALGLCVGLVPVWVFRQATEH